MCACVSNYMVIQAYECTYKLLLLESDANTVRRACGRSSYRATLAQIYYAIPTLRIRNVNELVMVYWLGLQIKLRGIAESRTWVNTLDSSELNMPKSISNQSSVCMLVYIQHQSSNSMQPLISSRSVFEAIEPQGYVHTHARSHTHTCICLHMNQLSNQRSPPADSSSAR